MVTKPIEKADILVYTGVYTKGGHMKQTTVFKSGNSQALRIPKDMRFDSETVFIEKVGNIAVIFDGSDEWAGLKLAQKLISSDFMEDGRNLNKITELELAAKKTK